jgi:enoyl-CoA hydratase
VCRYEAQLVIKLVIYKEARHFTRLLILYFRMHIIMNMLRQGGENNSMCGDGIVLYERKGHVAFITLNRPEKLNAMNKAMVLGLKKAWECFNDDKHARVAVLSSSISKAFCTGADVHELLNEQQVALGPGMPGIGIEVWKPIVAAISGHCLGAGLVLAMLSDIRIVSEDTRFGYPEARVGKTGGVGSGLTKYMPMGLALELLLTAETISAKRAYEIGFANRVVPIENLLNDATQIADTIAANAPLAVAALKKLAYLGSHPSILEVSAIGGRILAPLNESIDAKEGPRAILEKRKPVFKGE